MVSVIHTARVVSGGVTTADAWVALDDGRVAARGTGDGWRAQVPPVGPSAIDITDASGAWLVPGFVDIHCHGGGGLGVHDGAEGIAATLDTHTAHGTTRMVLSLATGTVPELTRVLGDIAAAAGRDPRVLGSHLEGPFLAEEFRGAHDPGLLRDPNPDVLDLLWAAASGTLRQITLAPEREHALAAIERFARDGVRVAVGHSGMDYNLAAAAFDHGASILTHAFNGMRGIHHRAPGPVVAAMRAEHVTLELICDTIHVHPGVIRMAFDGVPGRIALITDAMAATDAADGEYLLAGQAVTVQDGVARVASTGALAGSTLTLDMAIRNVVQRAGVPLATAVSAATEVPAAALGLGDWLGRLDVGYAADAVMLDAALAVTHVWCAGERVR